MNLYQCHKRVHAAKITAITDIYAGRNDGSCTLHFDDGTQRIVPLAWTWKHSVRIGGYFIEYEDGYTSFCPAPAFEAGYSLVEGT